MMLMPASSTHRPRLSFQSGSTASRLTGGSRGSPREGGGHAGTEPGSGGLSGCRKNSTTALIRGRYEKNEGFVLHR